MSWILCYLKFNYRVITIIINVLFLIADDMRAELSSYNGRDFPSSIHPPMFTPNLDALAAKSLLLKRAYVQQALCSPSRTSVLTGRRPDTTHVYDLHTYFREVGLSTKGLFFSK
jgi:iduronate 2-sulfatase